MRPFLGVFEQKKKLSRTCRISSTLTVIPHVTGTLPILFTLPFYEYIQEWFILNELIVKLWCHANQHFFCIREYINQNRINYVPLWLTGVWYCRVKPTTRMVKLKNSCAERVGVPVSRLRSVTFCSRYSIIIHAIFPIFHCLTSDPN